jgi:hypothetical protein
MAKVSHGLHPLEAERLNVRPEPEDRLPDDLLNQIVPLSHAERRELGITEVDEATGEVGSPELAAMLTVNPHDYSREQMLKADRLELWKRSREELKELLRIERIQNSYGIKL